MKRTVIIACMLTFCAVYSIAQKRNSYWAFGDSVGINFNTVPPAIDTTIIISSVEAAASIADSSGNLLFYVGAPTVDLAPSAQKYIVRNFLDSVIAGGDSLFGNSKVAQGLIIIPDPYDTAKYYIFHNYGNLYYAIVDMTMNGGLGEVISKNNLLKSSVTEKLHAVKAANGKDWWLVGMNRQGALEYFYKFKIDSTGIVSKGQQFIDSTAVSSAPGQIIFSLNGDKLLYTGGLIHSSIFDFDRCTGTFSNMINIVQGNNTRIGASFSPSGRYAYLSTLDSLFQFDLQAVNIPASIQLIYRVNNPVYSIGLHMLGPDGRIYIANSYDVTHFNYDSLCTHLTVIQNPDSPGVSCNILPYNFSLSSRRSFLSLPNFPNYNLGPIGNLNCDSILALDIYSNTLNQYFHLYPNPAQNSFIIESNSSLHHLNKIELYTISGELLSSITDQTISSKIIMDVSGFNSGIYFVKLVDDEGFSYIKKVVINR
jgi:hypothetical protein